MSYTFSGRGRYGERPSKVAMSLDARPTLSFYILYIVCLTPGDFTRQEENAASQHSQNVVMRPDMPFFIILLCLTSGNFTHEGEGASTQLVKWLMYQYDSCV